MPELSRYLFLAGALILLVLATLHVLKTPQGTDEIKGLSPRNPEIRAAMARETAILTRRTNLWLLWVGFNLSHSLGLILLGVVVILVGRNPVTFEQQASVFQPLAVVVAGLYMALAFRYWFRAPIVGVTLAAGCFVASWVVAAVSGGSAADGQRTADRNRAALVAPVSGAGGGKQPDSDRRDPGASRVR